MNRKFSKRLTEFLESECNDYDLEYTWLWNDDTECCEVEVSRYNKIVCLRFRYSESDDDLSLELVEDNWYIVREFDFTVKFFWMIVAAELFRR